MPEVNAKEIQDAIWYSRYSTTKLTLVTSRLCSYNEKIYIFIDSVKKKKRIDYTNTIIAIGKGKFTVKFTLHLFSVLVIY